MNESQLPDNSLPRVIGKLAYAHKTGEIFRNRKPWEKPSAPFLAELLTSYDALAERQPAKWEFHLLLSISVSLPIIKIVFIKSV